MSIIQFTPVKSRFREVYHYPTNWKEGEVNEMWIEEVDNVDDIYQYVAIAHNPREGSAAVVSNPRSYRETLQWVRKWCGNFSILPE